VYKETQFFKQQQQQRELLQQQQFGAPVPPNSTIAAQTAGSNPFGTYDPIGQAPTTTNPYVAQQTQYPGY
jgi:hypothetical protein